MTQFCFHSYVTTVAIVKKRFIIKIQEQTIQQKSYFSYCNF